MFDLFLKNLAGDKGRIPNSYIEGVCIPLDTKNLQEAVLVRAFNGIHGTQGQVRYSEEVSESPIPSSGAHNPSFQ